MNASVRKEMSVKSKEERAHFFKLTFAPGHSSRFPAVQPKKCTFPNYRYTVVLLWDFPSPPLASLEWEET